MNKVKKCETMHEHANTDREKRDKFLKAKYGQDYGIDQFDAMFKEQGEACAVCNKPDPEHWNWCVDHDHKTLQIRGILCKMCNSAISWLGDTLTGLERAIVYLKKAEEEYGQAQTTAVKVDSPQTEGYSEANSG